MRKVNSKSQSLKYFLLGSIGGVIGQFIENMAGETFFCVPSDKNSSTYKYIGAIIAGGFGGIAIEKSSFLNGIIAAVLISHTVQEVIDKTFSKEEILEVHAEHLVGDILFDIIVVYYSTLIFEKIIKNMNDSNFSEEEIVLVEEILVESALVLFYKGIKGYRRTK